ncbi:MAG: cell wall-binding repeat-containing protein [Coriobacteriia bacterium]|nr:cell wall-binding repeat-containing protein [Coriobacteriia bacterium]
MALSIHIERDTLRRTLARSVVLACVILLLLGEVTTAGAVKRETVMQRSQRWVDLKVPYSQSKYFEGYRTDCSGFVSMSWQLTGVSGAPISPATDTLSRYAIPIGKDRLLPGDMIVRPKTAMTSGHAVIFGGWADEDRTTYWCFEQSASGGGARLRQTPYPYWPSPGIEFAPFRYRGITDVPDSVTRIHGSDRYATAAAASLRAFPNTETVNAVVLATGESWPDALGAAGLAGAVGGPVLLTKRTNLPQPVVDEIQRLAPDRVLVVGGTAAVADEVVNQLRETGPTTVERIAGADRYQTAALVAQRLVDELEASGVGFDGVAYVATGEQFADALSVSPVSARRVRPVLLVHPEGIPEVTAAVLGRLKIDTAYVVGGESAVAPSVVARLETDGVSVVRISGVNRYATALAVADHGLGEGLSRTSVGIATGVSFADALAAGAALGQDSPPAVLYLIAPSGLDQSLRDALRTHRIDIGVARVYGGPLAVPDRLLSEVADALGG